MQIYPFTVLSQDNTAGRTLQHAIMGMSAKLAKQLLDDILCGYQSRLLIASIKTLLGFVTANYIYFLVKKQYEFVCNAYYSHCTTLRGTAHVRQKLCCNGQRQEFREVTNKSAEKVSGRAGVDRWLPQQKWMKRAKKRNICPHSILFSRRKSSL